MSQVNKCIFHTIVLKTNDPNVFECRLSYKCYGFVAEQSNVKMSVRVNSNKAWVQTLQNFYECL